jgi:hypothetical protein
VLHGAATSAPAATHSAVAHKQPAAHKPAPALKPSTGRVIKTSAPAGAGASKAEVNGQMREGLSHVGSGPLLVPAPPSSHAARAKGFTPTAFYSSTQLDSFSANCGFGVNETTIAESSSNPNILVAGANTYYNNSGGCQDSHAGVYSSSDGGQHWSFEVMPGLLDPASGDPGVVYDPKDGVFLYTYVEFSRTDSTVGRIGVEASADGVNWSRNTTLDSNNTSYGVDKPSITVDQNPSSPHYGRVAVAWTEFFGNNAVYQEDYTDDGGATWHNSDSSVNETSHECGNGTSEAFNANGELMIVWADCSGGTNSIYSELSTDGGATWSTSVDHQVTTTNPIEGAEQNTAANCFLQNGGSAFRCNSFPTLAGDPNSGDAGGQAFIVVWADVRSTTQSSQTANVSQLIGLSTTNDGGNWNGGPSFGFHFMAFNNFGDKFFPAASFSPSGRLTVSYSSREDDASSGNPNGKRYDEHQTEASSLTNLRNNSYVSYTTDGTLGDPGTLAFIGDYSGNSSYDANFDTFPIWTDVRSGRPAARTQDLCYTNCPSFLSPDVPFFESRTTGSTFTDFFRISMDPSSGSGNNFWNVVAVRPGTDGTTIDDDTALSPNHYYNTILASSSFGRPVVDYTVINGNSGNAPDTVYFPQVHSFSTIGGSYSIEWDAGHLVLGTALSDSMGSANVARVYDSLLSTGTQYYFGLRPAAGNTTQYSLALHSAGHGSEQGRPQAVTDTLNVAPGTPAFITYATGADPAQFDGVVVVNGNSGSGSYNLYRDTAAPSGSITIDGGAKATNSTTLNLTLSATNPTSGDPVMDMRFSINGGAYGAFQPFSTSASVNLGSASTPDGNKTVSVEYRNGAGAISAPATDNIYLVTSPPVVASVIPRGGSTAGGNTVAVNGSHLVPGSIVKFGGTPAATVTFVSAAKLNVVVPAHAAGSVHVVVTTPAGSSTASSSDLYAYGAPTITSVSPRAGPTGGGTTVTINGTGFVPGTTVKFGTTASGTVTFVSPNKLTAVSPAHAAGTVAIRVTTAGGTSAVVNADLFAFGAPAVTSITPNQGSHTGGTTVTMTGTGFVPGETVKFGTTASGTVTFVSPTKLTAVSPAHTAGAVHIRVTTAAGTSLATGADSYTYQ